MVDTSIIPVGTIQPEAREKIQDFISVAMQRFNVYQAAMREARARFEVIGSDFAARCQRNPIHHVESRLKKIDSIVDKMHRINLPITIDAMQNNIYDIAGVRVVCSYINDVYRLFDVILKHDDIEIMRVRDYIKNPKDNGYRSLHLVMKVPIFILDRKEYVPVEVQIRTIAMDFWASLEHDLKYKPVTETDIDISEELKKCSEDISDIENRMQIMSQLIGNDAAASFKTKE